MTEEVYIIIVIIIKCMLYIHAYIRNRERIDISSFCVPTKKCNSRSQEYIYCQLQSSVQGFLKDIQCN